MSTSENDASADPAEPTAASPSAVPERPVEFLVPGPTPESNAGTGRWAVTWIVFSLLLMLIVLGMSVVCFLLAKVTGLGS